MYNMSGGISKEEFCNAAKQLVDVLNSGLPYMLDGANSAAANAMRAEATVASFIDSALALRSVRAPENKMQLYGTQASALQMGAATINAIVNWLDRNPVSQIPADILDLQQAMVTLGQLLFQPGGWIMRTRDEQLEILSDGFMLSLNANFLALKYCGTVYAPLVAELQCVSWDAAPWVANAQLPPTAY